MPADAQTPVRGLSAASLDAMLARFGEGSIPARDRHDALARFQEMVPQVTLRSRNWKQDLAKLDVDTIVPFETASGSELDLEALSPAARRAGVTIERFSVARERHREAFERAFGRAVDTRDDKYASLALAFQNHGAFIDVPAGVRIDEPIVIGYEARAEALFPYTLVSLGENASATVVERLASSGASPFICGVTEIVLARGAKLSYAVDQRTSETTRLVFARRAFLEGDAHLDMGLAELGGLHSVSRFRANESARGAHSEVAGLFFTGGAQHVELETESLHAAPDTTSHVVIRTAGNGNGQGRYIGMIKIAEHAHGSDAALRDDALLLSPGAHIDSIPALEISANDVKAFHGATVGAISDEEIFYAQSRGIDRPQAERMIALGFFEPAVALFATDELRAEIRRTLETKIAPAAV